MKNMFLINKELYCQYLIASPKRYSQVGLAELFDNDPAHDSYTRWISNTKLKPKILWEYAKPMVKQNEGFLIVDDTVLDKWYGPEIEPVYGQYSGKHHRAVNGIGVINLIWNGKAKPEEAEHIPADFRVYDPERDGKTKNQHCHDLIEGAYRRGFRDLTFLADCSYSDLGTLKQIRRYGWTFVVGIKSNRKVSLSPHKQQSLSEAATQEGVICYLRGFGKVKIIKIERPERRNIDYIATNDLSLSSRVIRQANKRRWKVEEFHRGEKQTVGIERCQSRLQRAQRNHVLCSSLAFLAVEKYRLEHGISWQESEYRVIMDALRDYLKKPFVPIPCNSS